MPVTWETAHRSRAAKAPFQRFVDVFARYCTPAVMALAGLVAGLPPLLGSGSLGAWVCRALVLLVISCLSALVISTPVSIVSAVANAARSGVLIEGGAYLEAAGIALMSDDLSRLHCAIGLSREARRVIRHKIGLSLAIKAVFLTLAPLGLATLWMAVFADMGASLIVTLNGMRLMRCRSSTDGAVRPGDQLRVVYGAANTAVQ